MRYVMAAAVFVVVMAFCPRPVQAYGSAPWCAVVDVGWGDIVRQCHYRTFEECVPNVLAGNRGFCEQNLGWPGWRRPDADRPKHHRKRPVNRD